jgi:hypothetical protein
MGTGIMEDPPNPETSEVLQREILAPALLVHPDGPVGVKELPAVAGAAFTEILTDDAEIRKVLGGPDPKRKSVTFSGDNDFFISFKSTSRGARIHAGTNATAVVTITYQGPIYLSCGFDGTTNVGVIVEYWAE